MTEQERLLEVVKLGIDAEAVQQSDAWQAMCGIAESQAEEALEELKTVNPIDAQRIREIQNRVWRAESFKLFLEEIIQDGRQAAEILRAPEE